MNDHLDVPAYAQALKDAGVPVRCVLYERGGHGYGLRTPADQPAHRWAAEAADWLQRYAAPAKTATAPQAADTPKPK